MTTHRRRPVTLTAAAAVGLALGVLVARRQRHPPARPVPLHLVRRDAFERGVFADLAGNCAPVVYRPAPAVQRAHVPRPR